MRIFDWFYIDGDLPLTNKERGEIRRSAWKLWMRGWWHKSLYVALFLFIGVIAAASGMYLQTVWQMVILLTIYTGLSVLALSIVIRFCVAPLARGLLQERGIDVCIRCGYWLRGLGKDVTNCPECGWRREK